MPPDALAADPLSLAARAAAGWRLRLSTARHGGLGGSLLGASSGGTLEFQDFRDYAPGDDPRRIDWAAYARSDHLTVRLHREEILPVVEILVDTSASMDPGDGGAKRGRAVEVAALLWHLAAGATARARLWTPTEPAPRDGMPQGIPALPFGGAAPLAGAPALRSAGGIRRAMRAIVSDFLFPHDPAGLIRALGRGAAHVALVQVLTREERRPAPQGGARLHDVETGEERDLVLDADRVRAYERRLGALCDGLREACLRRRAVWVSVDEATPLEDLPRQWAREGLVDTR